MILVIRPIELSDLPYVLAHTQQSHTLEIPEQMQQYVFGLRNNWYGLIAIEQDTIVGICLYSIANTNRAFHPTALLSIDSLYIAPSPQSQHIGVELMKALAMHANSLQLKRIESSCLKSNHQINNFYLSIGARELDYIYIYHFNYAEIMPCAHPFDIRQINARDVEQVFPQIQTLAMKEGLGERLLITAENLHEYLLGVHGDFHGIVATEDGTPHSGIIGFCLYSTSRTVHFSYNTPPIYIDGLYVHPEFHGKGVGHALMLKMMHIAHQEDMNIIELWCMKKNDRANAFYQKIGGKRIDDVRMYRFTVDNLL